MKAFELSAHRRANVWLDEAPAADFAPTSLERRMVRPTVAVAASGRIAAVELYVPHGPMASYALVGAELVGADVDGLEIVVGVCEGGAPYASALASKVDQVKVGLPAEYVTAVVEGVVKAVESAGAPVKASLQFRWAAHGLVGSSPAIFQRASGVVMQLLMLPVGSADQRIGALLA